MRVHEPFRNVRHPYLPAVAQLRTAPQSSDQNFENPFNKALQVCLLRLWVLVTSHSFQHANQKSSETKKPIRVIRGYKLDSVYAPVEG
jgi:E3 ubiquitin-protein ligase UHRF1